MPGTSTEQISRCLPEGGNCWSLDGTDVFRWVSDGCWVLAGRCLELDMATDLPECFGPELTVETGTSAANCDLPEWMRSRAAATSSRLLTDDVSYDGCETKQHYKIYKYCINHHHCTILIQSNVSLTLRNHIYISQFNLTYNVITDCGIFMNDTKNKTYWLSLTRTKIKVHIFSRTRIPQNVQKHKKIKKIVKQTWDGWKVLCEETDDGGASDVWFTNVCREETDFATAALSLSDTVDAIGRLTTKHSQVTNSQLHQHHSNVKYQLSPIHDF